MLIPNRILSQFVEAIIPTKRTAELHEGILVTKLEFPAKGEKLNTANYAVGCYATVNKLDIQSVYANIPWRSYHLEFLN